MTFLNSDRKVSWDMFWVEQLKVQEIPHCSEVSYLFGRYSYPHFFTFPHLEDGGKMASGSVSGVGRTASGYPKYLYLTPTSTVP